jgi:hypothetical protein
MHRRAAAMLACAQRNFRESGIAFDPKVRPAQKLDHIRFPLKPNVHRKLSFRALKTDAQATATTMREFLGLRSLDLEARLPPGLLLLALGFSFDVLAVRPLVGLDVLEAALLVTNGVEFGALRAPVRGPFCHG